MTLGILLKMRGKKINYKLLDSEVPAFSDTSIEFLEKAVRKDHVVFEWGSGASTFCALRI